ncbi:MAG: DUF4230 domain-containing protein [Clostridia bacterium]|nr:DUF4230 domain-containing protein [Clostridia bacterium]
MSEREGKRRFPVRWIKRAIRIAALSALIALGIVYFNPISRFFTALFHGVDYTATAELLSHEMETVGELITLRATDTGILTGTINAKFLGRVSEISVPYEYEIGMGVSLSDVVLEPEESRLTVVVPKAQVLYDSFQVTGEASGSDFFGQATKSRYQKLQDEQHRKCREGYENDEESMRKAWDSACEQLKTLFSQWSGQNLTLHFISEEDHKIDANAP